MKQPLKNSPMKNSKKTEAKLLKEYQSLMKVVEVDRLLSQQEATKKKEV